MKMFNRYPQDIVEKLALKMKKKTTKCSRWLQYQQHQLQRHKKPLKILCVFDRSCNLSYLTEVLSIQKANGWIVFRIVNLIEYLNENENHYDLLIYQTWSSESDYSPLADQKFKDSFLPKVFFDAHASGSFDTYHRFYAPEIPRIKNAPSENFLTKFNVLLKTSHPIQVIKDKTRARSIDISYCVGLQTHEIRPQVYEKVMPYQSRYVVDLKNNQHNYVSYLRRVKISINVPGYGEGTFRHLYTLNAKAMLFAHESIKPIQLLPHRKLKENEDYISFNLNNFDEKLEYYLSHPKEARSIASQGFDTFMQGYSYTRSAEELISKFNELIANQKTVSL